MRRLTTLALVPAAAAALVVAGPVTTEAEAFDGDIKVNFAAPGVDAGAVEESIRSISDDLDRGEFTQEAVSRAFDADGGNYNVVIMNLDQKYDRELSGEKLYATVTNGTVFYGLWIFESGLFSNNGDGGYENWAYRGWGFREVGTWNAQRP